MPMKACVQKLILSLATSTLLVGCGASVVPNSTTQASRSVPPSAGGSNTSGKMAECIDFGRSTSMNTKGTITTYYDRNGAFIETYLNLRLKDLPSQVLNNSDYSFQIFPWTINSNGEKDKRSTPVDMYFVQSGAGLLTNSSPVNEVTKTGIQSLIDAKSLDSYGITTSNFFSKHMIVMVGLGLEWDAIELTYSDKSGIKGTKDVLLPAFLVNPNKYITKNNYPSLYHVHPYILIKDNSGDDDYFYTLSEASCANLFTSYSRAPSSVPLPEPKPQGSWLEGLWVKVTHLINSFIEGIF